MQPAVEAFFIFAKVLPGRRRFCDRPHLLLTPFQAKQVSGTYVLRDGWVCKRHPISI
jgi:hypothetical protein